MNYARTENVTTVPSPVMMAAALSTSTNAGTKYYHTSQMKAINHIKRNSRCWQIIEEKSDGFLVIKTQPIGKPAAIRLMKKADYLNKEQYPYTIPVYNPETKS